MCATLFNIGDIPQNKEQQEFVAALVQVHLIAKNGRVSSFKRLR
jgi:hypothetical protein